MRVSSVLNRWLNRLYKTLAIMLVFVAVLISAFRLLLPYAHHYRQNLQNYINENYQMEVVIGKLTMEWQKLGPVLVAEQVSLLNSDEINVFVKRMSIQVNVWRTLTEQQIVSQNLNFHGTSVSIDKTFLTSSQSVRNASSTDETSNDQFDTISTIFLNQVRQFSLTDSQIFIITDASSTDGTLADGAIDENNNQPIAKNKNTKRIEVKRFKWLNMNGRHQGQGQVVLDGITSNNLQVAFDLQGKDTRNLTGKMFLKANNLNITPWLDNYLMVSSDDSHSAISFSAWADINKGVFQQLHIDLDDSKLTWLSGKETNTLLLGKGSLLLKKHKSGMEFELKSEELLVKINDSIEQKFTLGLIKKADQLTANISALNLAMVKKIVPLFSDNNAIVNKFNQLDLKGNVTEIYYTNLLDRQENKHQFTANFKQVSNGFSEGIPGLDNVSGQISYGDQYLAIDLFANQGALDFKHHFVKPIPYNSLQMNIGLAHENKSWQLNVENIKLESSELQLSGDVAVIGGDNQDTTLSLLTLITNGQAKFAHHYYPLKSMSNDLVNYLKRALVKGKIEQAMVLYHGPFTKFPFEDNSGIFVVDAELTQSTFLFDQSWPVINDFSANLNFTNNSMVITGRKGNLVGLDVTGMKASIANLSSKQILTVDTIIKPTKAENVTQLMLESPLKKSVGAVLQQLVINDDIKGEFHLNLPLNATKDVIATGVIEFNGNPIHLQNPQMEFTQATGKLLFKNDYITTENLQVNWYGLPLALVVKGENKPDYYYTSIELDANWQEENWQKNIPPILQKYSQGDLTWQGGLALYQHHDGSFSYDFAIDSNLHQTALLLPSPYQKTKDEKQSLTVRASGGLTQSNININYGDALNFYGDLDHEKVTFSRAHLVLGDEKMLLPMDGFHITTQLDAVDFSLWQPFISDIIKSVEYAKIDNTVANMNTNQDNLISPSHSLLVRPDRVRGTIKSIDIFGQTLNNVSYNLFDKTHWWLLELNAKEARSRIKIYPDWIEQGIDIDADFIHLFDENKTTTGDTADIVTVSELLKEGSEIKNENEIVISAQDFADIPKLNVHCARCQIGALDFGELDFTLEHTNKNLIEIKSFKAKRKGAKLNFSAKWQYQDNKHYTSIDGDIFIRDIDHEVSKFGYESIIKDSGAKLDFSGYWQNSPLAFNVEKLNGDVKLKLTEGYLADIADKAKIFSLLSLQSLVRKLSLDFRDIFSDGMFFSNIKGNFHIEQGVSSTSDFRMEGSAGDLSMKGTSRLSTGDLDYKMSYKPNLTSSLPVLAWIATLNPVTFLAGVAIDQVITSQVVSEFKFELTGTLDKPNFQEVSRKSKDVSVGGSADKGEAQSSSHSEIENESFKENRAKDNG